jgi:GntR family transcriptional regulator, rspAB operon transcriptional repressor
MIGLMELTQIRRERAVDAVYQALRQAILGSLMKPGERLNVEELARKLGVSLTPVRQAIQQLATEGLIEIKPRSGTFVASLSAKEVSDTFDIRCALECLAAEKAAENIKPEEIRKLKSLLNSLREAVKTDEDQSRHESDNLEFHLVLLRASGNERLVAMYQDLNAHLKIARIHAGDTHWVSRLAEEQREHEAIVDALEKREVPALIEAIRKHITRAKEALTSSMTGRSDN